MKLQILSDLHIDTYARRNMPMGNVPLTDADLILVAGDTANADSGMQWLQQQAEANKKPIITIAGNHEYFSKDILTFDDELASWDTFDATSFTGLKVLQCSAVDVEDFRILGCTLWTDYTFEATDNTMQSVLSLMRDYQQIYAGDELFTPALSIKIHHKQRAWLKQALITAQQDSKKVVVMTHHSVSAKSVSERYAGQPSNAAFVTDFSDWMHADWAPKLWIHGHTHEAFDYKLGATRVVVNPRAYPGEVSSTQLQFDWAKVVEVC